MNGWFAAELVVTSALVALLLFRARLGARYVPLCLALSAVLVAACLGEWRAGGSGAWTIALGSIALAAFVVAWTRRGRDGRADGVP